MKNIEISAISRKIAAHLDARVLMLGKRWELSRVHIVDPGDHGGSNTTKVPQFVDKMSTDYKNPPLRESIVTV